MVKRLAACLIIVTVLALTHTGRSAEPDNNQFCLLGTEHSHSAVSGQCSDAYGSGNYKTALQEN